MCRRLLKRPLGFVFGLIALMLPVFATAQGINISLLSNVKPNLPGIVYGDVWGESNTVCLGTFSVASTYGVGIYDISNPSSPALQSIYKTNTSHNRFEQGMVRNQIGYFASWRGTTSTLNDSGGLHIVSLTNPAAPVRLAHISSTAGATASGFDEVHTMFLERNFLYEAAHINGTLTVKVFDVSNPASPMWLQDITTTNTLKVHQITASKKGTRSILYTSGWGDASVNQGQTDIWDVTDVGTQPAQWLGRVYSGPSSHSSWPTPDGNTLIVCRETAGGEVRFYDITTPPNPSPSLTTNPAPFLTLSSANLGLPNEFPHNPVVMSNLLFVSWYRHGVHVFDISDVTKPLRIGSYDTFLTTSNTTWEGNWGVYPFLGLNKLAVSDLQSGLFIFDASVVVTATNNYPPLLIRSPVSMTTTQGQSATLSATFTGSRLQYQWRYNSANLAGATNSVLNFPSVHTTNSGTYSIVASSLITNSLGTASTMSVTSAVITMSVTVPNDTVPTIVSQPDPVSVYASQSASFSVAVTGTGPFYYQWRQNGSDIPNATNNTFMIEDVEFANVGNYSVLVTNSFGSAVSSNALLSLIDSPFISNIQSAAGPHNAVVTWKTTVPTTGRVDYGTVASGGVTGSSITESVGTNHSIVLTSLTPGTTYNFQAVSQADGSNFISAVYQFTTEQVTAGGTSIILDNTNSAVIFEGLWNTGTSSTDKFGSDYRFATSTTGASSSNAVYRPNLPASGRYSVEVWYPQGNNRATNTPYFVSYVGGSQTFGVNQQTAGGGWRLLSAALPFAAGSNGFVRIQNNYTTSTNVVLADAVRFTYTDNQEPTNSASIPPWWSNFYFGGAGNPNADSDNDGFTDGQEYILGTSPVLPARKFSMQVFRSGGTANVVFEPSLPDRKYTLLYRPDITGGSWQPVMADPTPAGPNGESVFTLSLTNAAAGFYRIAVDINPNAPVGGRAAYGTARPFAGSDAEPACGPNRIYVQ